MMGILVRLGQAFENRTAGLIAAVVAGVSFETYTAMICGQETSMQMLSMIAMTAVIVTTPRGSWRGMAMAGLMAAVGINAREYGWAWLIIGGVMLLLQRRTWRELVVFASVAVALGGPWYLRNFIRCGNPFYNLTVGPFIGVNPVYNQLMKVYHDLLALPQQGSKQYLEAMYEPVITLPLQLTIGIAASIIWFRRVKLLWVVYVTVLGLWLASVSYTAGGLPYSTRVLGPSHALMAIPVGMVGALLLRSRRALARWAVIVVVAGYMLYTVAIDCAYPYFVPNPFMAVRMVNIPGERPVSDLELADAIVNRYPVGTRILTDNAYIHAAMAGRGRDLVAIWSPEVSFLWDTSLDEPTIRRKLLERRIARVLIYPRSANTPLMMKSNFFAATATSPWYPEIVQEGMLYLVRLEP
jgi:hypothetical protein